MELGECRIVDSPLFLQRDAGNANSMFYLHVVSIVHLDFGSPPVHGCKGWNSIYLMQWGQPYGPYYASWD